MPHAGFDFELLEECYANLNEICLDARRKKIYYMIGGDFNTCLDHGDRGVLLNSLLLDQFCHVANDDEVYDVEDLWTFRNSFWICRRIDYIILHRRIHYRHAHATR